MKIYILKEISAMNTKVHITVPSKEAALEWCKTCEFNTPCLELNKP